MIRETKQQKVRIPPWIAMAFVATVAGCSSAGTSDPGGGFPGNSTNTNPSTMTPSTTDPGSSTTNGNGAAAAPTATGAATAAPTATSTAPGTAPTAAPTSTMAGTTPPASTGNTGAFISTPADDLAPPDPAEGIQFVTPPGAFSVAPNQEIFPNYCVTVPKDIQVGAFRSFMTANSSHHFILYKGSTVAAGTPSSTSCSLGAGQWLYATSTPGAITGFNMPANVGLDLAANTQLIINMHFINPGTTTAEPQVKINVMFAQNVMYAAATMISFNTSISVPPATASGPGTQTVSGTCHAPVGANFFAMSTHTHKNATAAIITYNHNGTSTEVVHTGPASSYPADQEKGSGTDWEHPGVGSWTQAPFLTVQQGDSFTYSCAYSNTSSQTITVGETAAHNEMCMAVTYWFPASLGTASCL
jgi:hypothetical protein